MKTTCGKILILAALLLLGVPQLSAQSTPSDIKIMHYKIDEHGDTLIVETLKPAWCFGWRKHKNDRAWRKYYRLVHNFGVVYPYTSVARKIVMDVDSTIAANNFSKKQKEAYMEGVQKQLLKTFEPIIRKMTVSQGQLLCRLIDREMGRSSYDLVKEYRGRFSAWFWNNVGKLFDQDLKTHYDPNGIDATTEDLIRIWNAGGYNALYYSIFGKYPERREVPSNTK